MNMRTISGFVLAVILIVFFLAKGFLHPQNGSSRQVSRSESQIDGLNRNTTHLILTRHAKCRMECRHINSNELQEILHDGKLNEAKTEQDSRGPKYALEGYTQEHQHLRVVFAPEGNDVVVVTCIDLDNEWPCPDCK